MLKPSASVTQPRVMAPERQVRNGLAAGGGTNLRFRRREDFADLRDVRQESAPRAAPHGFGVLNPHYLIILPRSGLPWPLSIRVPIAP